MKKILFFALVLLSIGACSPMSFKSPEPLLWKNYKLDEAKEASTGSPMIRIHSVYGYPIFEPCYTQEFPEGILSPGQRWIAFHVLDSNESQYVLTSEVYSYDVGFIVNRDGEVVNELPIIDNLRRVPFRKPFIKKPITNLKDKKLFTRTGILPVESDKQFTAELLYSGIMNNIIALSYREYLNDMARPAFYQDLTYDLKVTKLITFRSLKMNVLEADNGRILFQIIEDQDLPWMPRY